MGKNKVLLVTGKFPGVSQDTDGGSIMVSHIIDVLAAENIIIDVLFTRTFNKDFQIIHNVRNTFFHPCKYRYDNKFKRRIQNVMWNSDRIKQLVDNYDKLIVVHCCKAFGLECLSREQIDKVVLFPMFLTPSYTKAGEIVPEEYTVLETKVLSCIKTIVTPSLVEKDELLHFYNVPQENVHVVPRAINPLIQNVVRNKSKYNNLIYIGSVKRQKNSIDAITLISNLKKAGLDCHLYMVGGIQDNEIFSRCKMMIDDNNLNSNVSIMGVLSQERLAGFLKEMDVNISVSKWETFGRGIIEGLAAGLPTVVLKDLKCLNSLLDADSGLLFSDNIVSMAEMILKLCNDPAFYKRQSTKTINVYRRFSIRNQQEKILQILSPELK